MCALVYHNLVKVVSQSHKIVAKIAFTTHFLFDLGVLLLAPAQKLHLVSLSLLSTTLQHYIPKLHILSKNLYVKLYFLGQKLGFLK